ncbi:MAG: ion channel [Deltaproteobacteria bacterium]|nr:ion channel [Deltaproteobacteria bacterium]
MLIIKIRRFFLLFSQEEVLGRRILWFVLLGLGFNLLFGSLFYLAEHQAQKDLSFADSLWWAMVTMTTVGYGDISPVTYWGRFVISYLCMFFGIGVIGYLVGFMAEHILNTITRSKKGLMKILDENHLILCNFPGENKLLELVGELRAHPGNKDLVFVLISDELDELPQALKKSYIRFVKGAPSDEEILFKANVLKCQGVIILSKDIGSEIVDERNFAIGAIIEIIEKEFQTPIKTVVEVVYKKNFKLIKRSNVDGMISTEGITSKMLAQEYLNPGVYDVIQQILSNAVGSQFFILPTRLNGFQVAEVQTGVINHAASMQLIGLIRDEKKILNPPKNTRIQEGDKLILLAERVRDFEEVENQILQTHS